jgi:GT2 family glycosyltransferase
MIVSIIVINYNTFELTCDCIESVIKYTTVPYEIILVDNNSSERDANDFFERFPDIVLIKSTENTGFAKGNNIGIESAQGDLILLLNSDTYIKDDSISKATQYYFTLQVPGALSIKILYPDGKFQHTARKFRSIKNELIDLVKPLLYFLPYQIRARLMLNQYFKGDFSTEVDWVSGAFMMFSKSILLRLPEHKLDERFFMYGEDQLWCCQFAALGYQNYYYADASVFHIANASTKSDKQLRLLRRMMKSELEVMEYRKGKGIYYHLFEVILLFKEVGRYHVKSLIWKFFKHKIR